MNGRIPQGTDMYLWRRKQARRAVLRDIGLLVLSVIAAACLLVFVRPRKVAK